MTQLLKDDGQPSETKPASHDSQPPKALLEFMVRDWKAPSGDAVPPIDHAASFHARRRALSKLYPGETLVIPTGHEKVRANDTNFRFRPGSDFYWLTGNVEPDCVLVMTPTADGHTDVLFVEPNPGKTDTTFFLDRNKGELWVGPRLGVPQSQQRFAIDECRPLVDLPQLLATVQGFRALRGLSDELDRRLPEQTARDKDFATALSELRLIKDDVEIGELSATIASTKRGFEDVIARLRTAKTEREVEGIFNLRARVEGNDVGYNTIAASGAHACILHWTRNDGKLSKKDLLLLDAGVEWETLYTADITRTLPISGKFTKEQRAVYQLVFDAQKAAFTACKPGEDFMEPNRRAMKTLAEGLVGLGVLKDAAEALADEHQFYKRYSLHNISHMLGIDVHDCAQARQEAYKFGKLRAGMVLTVEPGLYFQLDDLTVPEKLRGIGVRIEDDIVITETGFKNLSAGIPSKPEAVEAWMKKIWAKKK